MAYTGYGSNKFSNYAPFIWTTWRVSAWRWKITCPLASTTTFNKYLCCPALGGRLFVQKMDNKGKGRKMVQRELFAFAYPDINYCPSIYFNPVSYTHLRAHETRHDLVC